MSEDTTQDHATIDKSLAQIQGFLDLLGDINIDANDPSLGDKIMLTNMMGAMYQAKAQMLIAQSMDEISSYLAGIMSLLDHPAVGELLAMAGISLDGASDEEEEEEEEEEEGAEEAETDPN